MQTRKYMDIINIYFAYKNPLEIIPPHRQKLYLYHRLLFILGTGYSLSLVR